MLWSRDSFGPTRFSVPISVFPHDVTHDIRKYIIEMYRDAEDYYKMLLQGLSRK